MLKRHNIYISLIIGGGNPGLKYVKWVWRKKPFNAENLLWMKKA